MSQVKVLLPILIMLAIPAGGCGSEAVPPIDNPCDDAPPSPRTYNSPPPMTIDANTDYTATIKTTKGDIVLELHSADAPVTVNNFVFLARDGFYNCCTFHRVIPDFMAQGGDPTGTCTGGPGYTIKDEFNERAHLAGTLSMAHTAQPDSGGSQFFICYMPQPSLDGKYTVFGQVTKGMDVLNKLIPGDASRDSSFKGDTIIRITISEGL